MGKLSGREQPAIFGSTLCDPRQRKQKVRFGSGGGGECLADLGAFGNVRNRARAHCLQLAHPVRERGPTLDA